MISRGLALALVAAVFLSGCGKVKEKASGYYLSKARKTIALPEPSQAELESAYAALGKSLEYRPSSRRALETLETLTGKASKAGFAAGLDLEIIILNRVLRASPLNWPVYAAIIDDLSVRGDLFSLNELASRLEAAGSAKNASQPYEISMALALCYAAMTPWVESEGYLSLNKSPDVLVEKAREYVRVRRRAEELQVYLAKADAIDPARRKTVPDALRVSEEVALGDLASSRAEAERIYAAAARMDSEPAFLKAVSLTVQGNGALIKKDYSGARAFYRSAMRNQPGFIDARKQLVEVDFQEGAGLSLTGAGLKAGRQLLYRAYEESDKVLAAALETQNWLPFLSRDKFLADTYSIRAAVISAINAIEKEKLKNKAGFEREFKYALDEALRLNPQGKLARALLERYSKEGF